MLAANDDMAIGVIQAPADADRRVPADASVVGFHDIPVAAYVTPPLTTVRTDNALLAGVGLERLIDHLKDPRSTPRPFPSPMFELIVRGSNGPPRR